MNSHEYTVKANRTMSREWYLKECEQEELHYAIGICTEIGELVEAIGKRSVDKVNIMEEIGDIFWYLAGFQRVYEFHLKEDDVDMRFTYTSMEKCILDLVLYSNEILDIYKKYAYYGREINEKALITTCKTIFDICTSLLEGVGYSVHEAREINISKLMKRFPDKFNQQDANERDLESERKILEGQHE